MGNEYNGDKIVLRDTSGNQMSLARFFELRGKYPSFTLACLDMRHKLFL